MQVSVCYLLSNFISLLCCYYIFYFKMFYLTVLILYIYLSCFCCLIFTRLLLCCVSCLQITLYLCFKKCYITKACYITLKAASVGDFSVYSDHVRTIISITTSSLHIILFITRALHKDIN